MEALTDEPLSIQEALNPVDDDIAAEIEAEEAARVEEASASDHELEEPNSQNQLDVSPPTDTSIELDDSEFEGLDESSVSETQPDEARSLQEALNPVDDDIAAEIDAEEAARVEDVSLTDEELGEFDESAAFDAMEDELEPLDSLEPEPVSEDSIELDDSDLGEYDEAAALQDAFDLSSSEDSSTPLADEDLAQFDESATMATLLSEPEGDLVERFDQPLDSKVVDSAGMDIDAMLDTGEDWNGFNLTPEQQASISEDVPEEEKEVWEQLKRYKTLRFAKKIGKINQIFLAKRSGPEVHECR